MNTQSTTFTQSLEPTDKLAVFDVNLRFGEQKLEAWFDSATGESWGAYYAYIEPADSLDL